MQLIPEYHKDTTGELLKKVELIDLATAFLQDISCDASNRLVEKVRNTYQELMSDLVESRERTCAKVTAYAREFKEKCDETVKRLNELKKESQWTARNQLEVAIQAGDWEILNEINHELADWKFDLQGYREKWGSISHLSNWKYLFRPPNQEPKVLAVTNGRTQVFAIDTMQKLRVPESLSSLSGTSLCLPSSDWFLSLPQTCSLITPDFSSMKTVCPNMKEPRLHPGLAYYRGSVYLFGGGYRQMMLSTVECVDLDEGCSRLLTATLPVPTLCPIPCRHKDALYFGSIPSTKTIYSFLLTSEVFLPLDIRTDITGESLAMAFPNDEVVFLSKGGVFFYQVTNLELYQVKEPMLSDYDMHLMPMRYQGSWYFLGLLQEEGYIAVISEGDKELAQMGTFEVSRS